MSTPRIEVRPSPDGSFDELVATGVDVHLEMLDDELLWMAFSKPGEESRTTVTVYMKGRGRKRHMVVRAERE